MPARRGANISSDQTHSFRSLTTMKFILAIIVFALGTLLDFFFATKGITHLFQARSILLYPLAAILAFVFSCFRLLVIAAYTGPDKDVFAWVLRFGFWASLGLVLPCLYFGIGTTFANLQVNDAGPSKLVASLLICALVVFCLGSPMGLSLCIHKYRDARDGE
jgi:cation transporter-like permease